MKVFLKIFKNLFKTFIDPLLNSQVLFNMLEIEQKSKQERVPALPKLTFYRVENRRHWEREGNKLVGKQTSNTSKDINKNSFR